MFFKQSAQQLHDELAKVKQEIDSNPLSSDVITQSTAIIEQMKSSGREAEIDQELARLSLPSSDDIGKLIAQHALQLTLLQKKRIKLEKKLEKLR
ncbi:hypothetical protein D2E26_0617 [Bifidobacterium dolichotidis]|uniref:Uncharacterized protein n=1 Tax=Bifidobacterium dolichotidis TaxID=2306976 RepID=A0A430FT26_9BIFI|nr:hypothetical protein [Bifidobacterium dolichotidis]RSX56054.1 hypothetical protein D2E26_0617 [Bifidobacterium dolichotidis]